MKDVMINHRKGERPNIDLTVRRVEPNVWYTLEFYKYHYLTADLNKACKCFLFEWNDVPVGFVAILNTPRKRIPYGCSISRIVILPDFQGLGLSTIIFNFCGGMVKSMSDESHDYHLYIKTAHSKFGDALSRNPNVKGTQFDGKTRIKSDAEGGKYRSRLTRRSYCKEYIGAKRDGYQDLMLPIAVMRKRKNQSKEQLLFK